jgi:hypothetical protein
VNGDEQKLQKQTQFVRRRRRVFDSSNERKKNPLQQPASLEITHCYENRHKSFVFITATLRYGPISCLVVRQRRMMSDRRSGVLLYVSGYSTLFGF